MSITFLGFDIARRALSAHRLAMDTAGHNIANANTKGYSRQRVNLAATLPYPGALGRNAVSPGQLGTGVEVTEISRQRDIFLDNQFRSQNTQLGRWNTREQILTEVEQIFQEPSDQGLRASMDRFWQAWQTLANNPESVAAREAVKQRGVTLVETFRYIDKRLHDFQWNLDTSVRQLTNRINDLAMRIAGVNNQIRTVAATGMEPNDLADERDRLLDELSGLVNIQVTNMPDRTVRVLIGGVALVDGERTAALDTYPDALNNGFAALRWEGQAGIPVQVTGGELKAYLEVRDGSLAGYREQVRSLAWALASAVNARHAAGYDLNGAAGGAFFSNVGPLATFDIQQLDVDPAIAADGRLIAAASTPGAPGDGDNALAVAGLKFTALGAPVNATADDYYRQTIAALGIESQQAQHMAQTQQALVQQVDNQRQSVAGVNLDEEMMSLIQSQHAFEAASRLVTIMDEMMDTIINRMGIAGR